MLIHVGYDIEIEFDQATEVLTLLDPHKDLSNEIVDSSNLLINPHHMSRGFVDSNGNFCVRWTAMPGKTRISKHYIMKLRQEIDYWDDTAVQSPIDELPDDVLKYLLPSRYCESDLMMAQAWSLFGNSRPGWERVRAIFDYVNGHINFGYQYARSTRTAKEAFQEQKGVCRDFAHLAITLCRCMNLPARYVNGYLGDIGVPADPAPIDYNAWCEVWLGGQWFTLDARHNTARIGRIVVARGRDAADIPLIHTFGSHKLNKFKIWTHETDKRALEQELLDE